MQQPKSIAEILKRYPGPVELEPQASRWRVIMAFNLAFVAAGLIMMVLGQRHGFYVALAFGVLALPLAIVALPGAAKLRIQRDGFVATALYRGRFTCWQDVGEFRVAQLGRATQHILVYDDASLTDDPHLFSDARYAGHNSALPSTYGLSAEDLARVLNHWRERALEAGDDAAPAK